MSKKLKFLVLTLFLVLQPVLVNHAVADRIKDLTSVAGARSNQLIGYGLVVGLQGTGDEDKISFTGTEFKESVGTAWRRRRRSDFKLRPV